jgi:hypothetical protein
VGWAVFPCQVASYTPDTNVEKGADATEDVRKRHRLYVKGAATSYRPAKIHRSAASKGGLQIDNMVIIYTYSIRPIRRSLGYTA